MTQLLENAIESRNIDSLKSALAVHAAVNPVFITPLSVTAKTLLDRLEAELAVKNALIGAIAARNRDKLKQFIQEARDMNFLCNELAQADALLVRLDQEVKLIALLKAACASQNLEQVNSSIAQCMELGMDKYLSLIHI